MPASVMSWQPLMFSTASLVRGASVLSPMFVTLRHQGISRLVRPVSCAAIMMLTSVMAMQPLMFRAVSQGR
jgi:hypothetical protein